jgi:hypothetical protein
MQMTDGFVGSALF